MSADAALVLVQETPEPNLRDMVECGQGLALLRKAGLKAKGFLVRNHRQREQLAASLLSRPPRLVFLHVGKEETPGALALLNDLRALPANVVVTVGGPYGTLCSHEFTTHHLTQGVVLGQWVDILPDLVKSLVGDGYPGSFPGIWWKGARGWELTNQRTYQPDLTAWPDPSIEEFRIRDLMRINGGVFPIHASRGFPFQGLFSHEPVIRHLQASNAFYHVRPPRRVADEAARLAEEYKIEKFLFVDDIFPWNRDWNEEFATMWESQVGRPFAIRSAADHLFPARLAVLKQAGLAGVELAVETGDEGLRRRLSDLQESNEMVAEAIASCREAGAATRLRVLLGVPNETGESLRGTVEFVQKAGASTVRADVYRHWPDSVHWMEVERSMTGQTVPRVRFRDRAEISRDILQAQQEIIAFDAATRASRTPRMAEAALDALPDYALAKIRSPFELGARVDEFHTTNGSRDVVALRVPSEIIWSLKLPKNPAIEFGILIEPAMPGERTRLPVSFSVKVTQNERTFRLFQKIMIQALDPDSRRWHWFKLPITSVRPGWVDITLEALVFGHDGNYIPPDRDLWAGWSRVRIVPSSTKTALYDETTENLVSDEEFGIDGLQHDEG